MFLSGYGPYDAPSRKWSGQPMPSRAGSWNRMYRDYKDLLSAFHAHGVRVVSTKSAAARIGRPTFVQLLSRH